MHFYSTTWPEALVPPKLQMLEDHAIPLLKKYVAGFGFYGEKDGELIHLEFNNLKRIYQSIPCPTAVKKYPKMSPSEN